MERKDAFRRTFLYYQLSLELILVLVLLLTWAMNNSYCTYLSSEYYLTSLVILLTYDLDKNSLSFNVIWYSIQ